MKHKWFENSRTAHITVRICERCTMRKISRHEFEGGRAVHWPEFFRGTERIQCDGTPACEPVEVDA